MAVMQFEAEETKMKSKIRTLETKVAQLKENEEDMKNRQEDQIQELNDQIEQAQSETTARLNGIYTKQMAEIRKIQALEREQLQAKLSAAHQELKILQMDHSQLIANTTFQDQQEQVEFRAFAEVQI